MPVEGGAALEKAIYTILNAQVAPGKVYHAAAPDNITGSFVVYLRQSTDYEPTLTGWSQLFKARVQVDLFAATQLAVAELARLTKKALGGLRQGAAEEQIAGCWPDGEFSAWDEDERGHRRTLFFQVMMRESTADPDGGPLP